MYYAIKDENQIFIGYTENEEYSLAEGHTKVTITEEALDALKENASTQKMKYYSGSWDVSDRVEDVKKAKIEVAKSYFITRQIFKVNTVDKWMTKEALRAFWTDIQILKADIAANTTSACSQTISAENMTVGTLNGLTIANAEKVAYKARCYMKSIEDALQTHLTNIEALTTSSAVNAYDEELLYPSIINIEI